MEVHKPKLIKNWRELLKEWGIIVLGVLTALLAEQAVQSIEWQHKVRVAIADMEQELSAGDGPESYARLAMHDCLGTRLTTEQVGLGRELSDGVLAGPADQNTYSASAVLQGMTIRVLGYVGPPTADVTVGWVGSDRIVSDGTKQRFENIDIR